MKKRKKAKAKAKAKKRATLISVELQFTHDQKFAIDEVAALANRSFEDVCCVMLAMGMYMHRAAIKTAGSNLAGPEVTEFDAAPGASPTDTEASPAQADLPASAGGPTPAPESAL